MNAYEALYIIKTQSEDENAKASIQKYSDIVTANGGTVDQIDEWGKRQLAYAIDYNTDGYYVLMSFTSGPEFPRELERNFKNDENILRYMVTRKEA